MIGEIHNCRAVGSGVILNSKLIIVAPRVEYTSREIAGIPLLTVGRAIGEKHPTLNDFRVPQHTVEAAVSTMQSIRSIVGIELIWVAIDCEASEGNAVGKATRSFSGTGTIVHIVGIVAISKHNVIPSSLGIGNNHTCDAGTKARQLHHITPGISEPIHRNLPHPCITYFLFYLHKKPFLCNQGVPSHKVPTLLDISVYNIFIAYFWVSSTTLLWRRL